MDPISELQAQVFELQAQVNDLATVLQGTGEELQQKRQRRVEREAHTTRARRITKMLMVVVLAVAMLGGGARELLASGVCVQTLPSPLTTFCSGDPALAKDVNDNFKTLATWMKQKVGTVGSPDVTVTGAANVTGLMSAKGGLDVTGVQKVSSNLTVNGAAFVAKDLSAGGKATVAGQLEVNQETYLKKDVKMTNGLSVLGALWAGSIKTPGPLSAQHITANIIQLPQFDSNTACTTTGSIGYRKQSLGAAQYIQVCICNGKSFNCLNVI